MRLLERTDFGDTAVFVTTGEYWELWSMKD